MHADETLSVAGAAQRLIRYTDTMPLDRPLTLAFDSQQVEISRDRAADVADYLWQGHDPGAATSAAKLTRALAHAAGGVLTFEPYEVQAVRAALAALRLLP